MGIFDQLLNSNRDDDYDFNDEDYFYESEEFDEFDDDIIDEYDANALAFYLSDGTMLGYLPKKDQPFARLFMKKGYIECKISNIDDTYIDTETILSEDIVDFDEYNNSDVRISRTESYRGFGNSMRKEVTLEELVKNNFL